MGWDVPFADPWDGRGPPALFDQPAPRPDLFARADTFARGVLGPAYGPINAAAQLFNPMVDFRLMQQGGREMMAGQPIQGMANAAAGFLSMFGPGDEAMDMLKLGALGAMGAKRGLTSVGVYNRADELADILRKEFPDIDVGVSRSRNTVGDSAYVKINAGQGSGRASGEVRVSDHGLGPNRFGDYVAHVTGEKPFDLEEFMGRLRPVVERSRAAKVALENAIGEIQSRPSALAQIQQAKTYAGAVNSAKAAGVKPGDGASVEDVVRALWVHPAMRGSP